MADLKYVYAESSEPIKKDIIDTIKTKLDNSQKVCWLLSGGSAIAVAIDIANHMRGMQNNLENLTVSLIDERFGPDNYEFSNWNQLIEKGFDLKPANYVPVLQNLTLEDTANKFEEFIKQIYSDDNIFILGQFGIGPDGHTAGILPSSPACKEMSGLVYSYDWTDFKRITTTIPFIERVDLAVAYAAGEEKVDVIRRLRDNLLDIEVQPAQALKRAKSAIVYSQLK